MVFVAVPFLQSMAEGAEETNKFDGCLRQLWKIGETLTVQWSPSVEAMIAGTKWVNEMLMVILVVPPFYHKDASFEKAALIMRTATSCSRKKLSSYQYPFPTDSRIHKEILQAAASYDALEEVVAFLNVSALPPAPSSSPVISSSSSQQAQASSNSSPLLVLPSNTDALNPQADDNIPIEQQEIVDRLSVQLVLSRPDEPPTRLPPEIDTEVISQLTYAVARQLKVSSPLVHSSFPKVSPLPRASHLPPLPLPTTAFPALQPAQDILHSPRRHRTPSPNSRSRSSSNSQHSHVRNDRNYSSSGIFLCPFASDDSRLFSNPQRRMRAKAEERKYLRRALHDIYSDFTTLKYFCDSLHATFANSSSKPFASDLLWLQFHADYLDCLLLHMTQGPWVSWNELIVDKLARSFLELLIRVYPNRAYPDLFDESVRKWMKRRRVGVCTQFGPIPSFLSDARVTESGVQPKNGWGGWQNKDQKKADSATSTTNARAKLPVSTPPEKK